MTSAPAIGFEYRPSRLPAWVFCGLLTLAVLAVAVSGIGLVWKCLATAVACLATASAVRDSLRTSIVGLGLGQAWRVYRSNRREEPARLLSHRLIGPVVWLRLATASGIEVAVLAPDNSDPDIRRRVRMRLPGAGR